MIRAPAAIAAIALPICGAAAAHDLGCDGRPPPADIKEACCGAGDAHALAPGQWSIDKAGRYHIQIGNFDVTADVNGQPLKPSPSPDGCAWGFWRRQAANGYWEPNGEGDVRVYCFLLPMIF